MPDAIELKLAELPEPHASSALRNYRAFNTKPSLVEPYAVRDALSGAFRWADTPEGGAYWSSVYLALPVQ